MFSYYGSKSKLLKYYPEPKHNKIIEPFGGTAKYSLKYFENDVIIYELFHKIYKIWIYLQNASEKDILSLPSVGYKEKIPTSLSLEERWLIGYCVARGTPRPSTMGHKFNSWDKDKMRIASDLRKIRHWKIYNSDGLNHPNEVGTWFIDPPYEKMGYKYNFNKVDYGYLSEWSKSRNGQVIVCENADAQWLPFTPIKEFRGAMKTNMEAVWING